MAWTAPMTAVANSAFTAAQFNTHVRDNLNETAPAKATTAGSLFVGTGANAIAERVPAEQVINTEESTTSTSFTDLATPGPSVSVTTGVKAIVIVSANIRNSSANGNSVMDFEVSGATSRSASDLTSLNTQYATGGDRVACSIANLVALTPGSNTFTARYRVASGTGTYLRRRIIVLPL